MALFGSGFNSRINNQGGFKTSFADKLGGIGASLLDLEQGTNRFGAFQNRIGGLRDDFRTRQAKQSLTQKTDDERAALLERVEAGTQGMTPQQKAWALSNPEAFMKIQGGKLFAEPTQRRTMTDVNGIQRFVDTGEQVFKGVEKTQAPVAQKIIKGADGFNYDAATGERVLPDVQAKPVAPKALDPTKFFGVPITGTMPDGTTAIVQLSNSGEISRIGGGSTEGFVPEGTLAEASARAEGTVTGKHAGELTAGATKARGALSAMQDAVGGIGSKVDLAIEQSNFWNTGVGKSKNPFAGGQNLTATLKTIQADAAFGALQEMRDNSKTGGALGQVSERELALLQAAKEEISRSQSEAQLDANLKSYKEIRQRAMQRVKAAYEQDYGRPFTAFGQDAPSTQTQGTANQSLKDKYGLD